MAEIESERKPAELPEAAPVPPPRIVSSPAVQMNAEARRAYFRDYAKLRRSTAMGRRVMRASNLRAMHKITLERYEHIYRAQGGRCAICRDSVSMGYDPDRAAGKRGPVPNTAHIDHDHACCPGSKSCGSCIRGLLCGRCNAGIERFRDNPELLRQAADYVTSGTL